MVKTEPQIDVDKELRLFVGGPVDQQRTWVLMADAQGPDDEQREIAPGVLLSVSHELTLQLLQAPQKLDSGHETGYGLGVAVASVGVYLLASDGYGECSTPPCAEIRSSTTATRPRSPWPAHRPGGRYEWRRRGNRARIRCSPCIGACRPRLL